MKDQTAAGRLRAARRESTDLRIRLRDLTNVVARALVALDSEMLNAPPEGRGNQIAKICNGLQLANDTAKRFGLARTGWSP